MCWSANDDDMFYAWSHDVYNDHCFLGFIDASPMLTHVSYTRVGSLSFYGYDVICYFYEAAVSYDYSVGDALEYMSYATIGCGFYYDERSMHSGYTTYWPGNWGMEEGWYDGSMTPIGNMGIYLT
jgi:hypothetical protein